MIKVRIKSLKEIHKTARFIEDIPEEGWFPTKTGQSFCNRLMGPYCGRIIEVNNYNPNSNMAAIHYKGSNWSNEWVTTDLYIKNVIGGEIL